MAAPPLAWPPCPRTPFGVANQWHDAAQSISADQDYADPQTVAVAAVADTLRSMVRETDSHTPYPSILREEYRTIIAEVGQHAKDGPVLQALANDADWTPRGAQEILALAREYGTSLLRSALALAEALDIEDGSRRF